MAFALDAIVNDVTYSLSDGNPFRLESAQGLAMPSVRRLTERGPRQDGDTDLGYRLEPRTITLALNFYADTHAALDGHRDTLATIFKPARGYDIKLRVTRDDGAVRQIDCHTVGPVDVRLVREERPGKLHRAVVQLRAADPTWYDPTGQVEVPLQVAPYWVQGDNQTFIPMSNVLDYDVNPDIGQLISGSVAASNPWSFFFETTLPDDYASAGTTKYMVAHGKLQILQLFTSTQFTIDGEIFGAEAITAGSHTYLAISDGGTAFAYRDEALQSTEVTIYGPDGGSARWRAWIVDAISPWDYDTGKVAFYDIALTENMRQALSNPNTANTVTYIGDWPSYPTLILTGPIATPEISIAELNRSLTFGTRSVATDETWTITLDGGNVKVLSSITGDISGEIDGFENWRLEPDPVVSGGENLITIASGTIDGTQIGTGILFYTPRYVSY